jgi:hypothetical protein
MAIRFGSTLARLISESVPATESVVATPLKVPDTLPRTQRAVLNAIAAIWGGVAMIPEGMPVDKRAEMISEHLRKHIHKGVSAKTVVRALEAARMKPD